VPLPVGALINPTSNQGNLFSAEALARIMGRHSFVIILGGHPVPEMAGRSLSRDHQLADITFSEQSFATIQPQIGFSLRCIWTMTLVAVIRQDRRDITSKLNRNFWWRSPYR
jgi:hypothetical protein